MTKSYWLHILRHRGSQERIPPTYTLARAEAPARTGEGGAMPTVHHPSWEHLSSALSSIGCDSSELLKAKNALDEKGSYTITEVHLDEAGLRKLGFTDV